MSIFVSVDPQSGQVGIFSLNDFIIHPIAQNDWLTSGVERQRKAVWWSRMLARTTGSQLHHCQVRITGGAEILRGLPSQTALLERAWLLP